jgi:glycosyltransferase involved in cell wall biosynthesis
MPVHNGEKNLGEAIQSIINQTFGAFELVAIDDGSTDRTPSILRQFAATDSRIKIHEQENVGLIATLNRGICLARGEYIARMDGDDVSLSQRFEKQVAYLERHKDVGVVGTWIQDIDAKGNPGPIWPLPTSPATIPWFLMFGDCMAHPSVMMRREVVQRLGYRADAVHVEDYDLWTRAIAVTRLANLPEVLLKYRVSSQSVSSRYSGIQAQRAEKLQEQLKKALLSTERSLHAVTPDLLLNLYDAYRKKYSLDPGDESEIALDVLRRLYLSGGLATVWRRVIPLLPMLFSTQAFMRAFLYTRHYIGNIPHGFATQRQTPE